MARRELWENTDRDLYQILGVNRDASGTEVADAWKQAAKLTHPDSGGTVADFQQLEVAYRVLSDPTERLRYDRATDVRPASSPSTDATAPAQTGTPPGTTRQPGAAGAGGRAHSRLDDVGDYRDPGPSRPIRWWLVIAVLAAAMLTAAAAIVFADQFVAALPLIAGAGVIAWMLGREPRRGG